MENWKIPPSIIDVLLLLPIDSLSTKRLFMKIKIREVFIAFHSREKLIQKCHLRTASYLYNYLFEEEKISK